MSIFHAGNFCVVFNTFHQSNWTRISNALQLCKCSMQINHSGNNKSNNNDTFNLWPSSTITGVD